MEPLINGRGKNDHRSRMNKCLINGVPGLCEMNASNCREFVMRRVCSCCAARSWLMDGG